MPTPLGHGLIGLNGYLIGSRTGGTRAGWGTILFFLFFSFLPDLDFLPGLLTGRPALYHRAFSHSLGFALLASGLLFLLVLIFRNVRSAAPLAALAFGLLVLHLAADYFTVDFRPPQGIPLFWPLSSRTFIAPTPFILHTVRGGLRDILIWHNLLSLLWELTLFGLPIAIYLRLKSANRKEPSRVRDLRYHFAD